LEKLYEILRVCSTSPTADATITHYVLRGLAFLGVAWDLPSM